MHNRKYFWQVQPHRNDIPFGRWVEMDIDYILHRNISCPVREIRYNSLPCNRSLRSACHRAYFRQENRRDDTVMAAFLMPVIRLYTSGVSDAAIYDSTLILLLFAEWSVMSGVEISLIQLQTIAGKFDDTKNQAVAEMLINIVISLIATWKLGIAGCLIGTIAALFYRINAMIIYSSRSIFSRECSTTYKRLITNAAVAVAVLILLGTESGSSCGYGKES